MAPLADPLDAGLTLARALAAHDIPYALGGALAYGIWGIPRATLDVDINVFLEESELGRLVAALSTVGVALQLEQIQRESAARGMFMTKLGDYRIDVFTPSIPFSREAERTRTRIVIEGQEVDFLSAEALAVFKLLFFRPKDIVDLERLLQVQAERLDAAYVRRELVAMMGEHDERVARWDALVAACAS